jgi:hypothetical protein
VPCKDDNLCSIRNTRRGLGPCDGNIETWPFLSHDKFNASFAVHDALDERAAAKAEKLSLKTSKKATT